MMYEDQTNVLHQDVRLWIFQLTLALYRVTDLFSFDEPMRIQLREKANGVFDVITGSQYDTITERDIAGVLSKIAVVKGYLKVARAMRFAHPVNMRVLEREYELLAGVLTNNNGLAHHAEKSNDAPEAREQEIEEKEHLTLEQKKSKIVVSKFNNKRQERMIRYIEEKQGARISDLASLLRGVSIKTIQRDVQDLMSRDVLAKSGERRWTIYSIKK